MRLALDRHSPTWLIGAAVFIYLGSAAAGFFLGFGFARNAQGGALMGLVAGINGALFCTLVADWLLTRLFRRPGRSGA